jgi:hypothetical protein
LVLITATFLGDAAERSEFGKSDPEVQRKLQPASALIQRFLSRDPIVKLLCEELLFVGVIESTAQ